MEIKELQERVDAWIRKYGVRYFSFKLWKFIKKKYAICG